jgi:hypothetical protein
VPDLAFYNAGCNETGGLRLLLVPLRRLLRRVLRPVFFRQAELFQGIIDRIDRQEAALRTATADLERVAKLQEELARRVDHDQALYWDHVALVRRLVVIEDQLAALTGNATPGGDEGDTTPSIRFPAPESRSKVC